MVFGVRLHSQTAPGAFAGRRGPRGTVPEQTQAASVSSSPAAFPQRGDPHPRQPHRTVPLRSEEPMEDCVASGPARSQGDLEESGNLASSEDAAPGEERPPKQEGCRLQQVSSARASPPQQGPDPCLAPGARTVPSAKGLRSRKWPPQCPSRQHGVDSGSVSIPLCGAGCEGDCPIPLSSRSGTFLSADFAEDAAPWSGAEHRSRPPRSCWVVEKEGGQVLSATVKLKIIIMKKEWVSYLLILTINRLALSPSHLQNTLPHGGRDLSSEVLSSLCEATELTGGRTPIVTGTAEEGAPSSGWRWDYPVDPPEKTGESPTPTHVHKGPLVHEAGETCHQAKVAYTETRGKAHCSRQVSRDWRMRIREAGAGTRLSGLRVPLEEEAIPVGSGNSSLDSIPERVCVQESGPRKKGIQSEELLLWRGRCFGLLRASVNPQLTEDSGTTEKKTTRRPAEQEETHKEANQKVGRLEGRK
ncbi:PREDICTED: uncharacterized protein LOC105538420 [Mandrillus leucophaeus]|uniref:uncharacterized protein LOC105538420 n=1 Tax=Mandrillus leucophaeus TaxID=9568 RepID=UPI0005F41157|nr:PREDICTED: uncharacterized protein LOC105538420 [Mandrillus leucophaeus]